jgi:hypothetical protein
MDKELSDYKRGLALPTTMLKYQQLSPDNNKQLGKDVSHQQQPNKPKTTT